MARIFNGHNVLLYEHRLVNGTNYISFVSTLGVPYSREITPEICKLLSGEYLTDQSVVGINRYIMGKDEKLDLSYPSRIKRQFVLSQSLREYIESGEWNK